MDGNIDGMNDADVREKNEGKKSREITRWDMACHTSWYSTEDRKRHESVTFEGSRNETVKDLSISHLLANGWEPFSTYVTSGTYSDTPRTVFRRPAGVFRVREREEEGHKWNSDKMEYENVTNIIIEKEDIEDYPYPAEDMDMGR